MSFSIATSGLNAITQQLGAISNNIANSGTVGYKSMRAEFASLYAGGQPLGVGVTSISQSLSQNGNLSGSSRNLDLGISGNGMFVTKDSSGKVTYQRAGYLMTDPQGYLTTNSGKKIQGYPIDANGQLQTGIVSDLQLQAGGIPAKATEKVDFTANLDANAKQPTNPDFDKADSESYNNTYSTKVYDSLGREHNIEQYFVKTDDGKWEVHYFVDGTAATPASTEIEFNEQGVMTAPTKPVELTFTPSGAQPLEIAMNYAGTTQFGTDFNVSKGNADGYAAGERNGEQVDSDGKVYATFSNGERLLQGQIVLASFASLDGLSSEDGTSWSMTNKSGAALLGAPGTGLNGTLKANTLEDSNVDMTAELVGLMSAQRNYQANTKVISTNDQMMSALFQAL